MALTLNNLPSRRSCSSIGRGASAASAPGARQLIAAPRPHTRDVAARAKSSSSSFWPGFLVGGVVVGALTVALAPQITKVLQGGGSGAAGGLVDGDAGSSYRDPEATRRDLNDQIAKLNASIDEVAARLPPGEQKSVEGQVEVAV